MSDTEKPQAAPVTTAAPKIEGTTPAPAPPAPPPGRQDKKFGKKPFGGGPRKPRILDSTVTFEDEQRFSSGPKIRDLDAAIEGELQAALEGISGESLFANEKPAAGAKPGASEGGAKKGKIISVHGPDVFVEIPGGRSQGLLPLLQFPDGPPKVGSEVDVQIEGYDNANGLLILTRRGAAVVADWSSVAEGMVVEARVIESNKGGLAVEINGIRAFMPISQIDMYRVEQTDQFVNQRLLCMVTEVNQQERNLVVSRRALLEKEREAAKEKLWQELAEGQIRDGIVRSVRDFGAFVDLGGADGLLHVSEMSWQRVQDATSVVQPGQALKVVVLRVDRETRKISLGLKQLLASPWDAIQEKFIPGHVVPGKVTRLMDFGAFVELEPGVEGLVHISEVAPQRVHRVSDYLQADQEVQVKILNVDKEQKRISLSLKAAIPEAVSEPEPEEAEEVVAVKPPRPRTTPLRGGIGGDTQFRLPEPGQ